MDVATVEALIDELVRTHGEAGVCPSAEDWRRIFALAEHGPVEILNLLRFADRVDSPEGAISGADAYARYSAGNAGAFTRVGAEVIYFGRVGHRFGLGAVDDWDAVIVTRYPDARALAQMWLDPEFIEAHASRIDGLVRSQVLVFGR